MAAAEGGGAAPASSVWRQAAAHSDVILRVQRVSVSTLGIAAFDLFVVMWYNLGKSAKAAVQPQVERQPVWYGDNCVTVQLGRRVGTEEGDPCPNHSRLDPLACSARQQIHCPCSADRPRQQSL